MAYNFGALDEIFAALKNRRNIPKCLNDLKTELNKLFSDCKCKEVIFTENTDSPFFGMCVLPDVHGDYITRINNGMETTRFTEYYIDIDSKLISPALNISSRELTAILLHEVGHIVNTATPSKELSDILTVITQNDPSIVIDNKSVINNQALIRLGVLRSIKKMTSLFHKEDEEFIADEFVVKCGYGKELETAFDKIIMSRDVLRKYQGHKYKITSLIWSLSIYRNLNIRRRQVIRQLKSEYELEGSTLMQRYFKFAYEEVKNPKIITEKFSLIENIKFSDIKKIENDMYIYNVRVANIEDETEAIITIKDINYRIDVLQDYIAHSDTSPKDRERYSAVLRKYQMLREELVRSPKYQDKMYGLFIKYPEIKSRYG